MFPLKDNIPTRRFPIVTVAFIAINVIVYLFLQPKSGIDFSGNSLDQRRLFDYAAIPCRIDGQCETAAQLPDALPPLVTLFTAMFSHAGLLHLGGNMLFLWIFGNNVEDAMGRVKFVLFYLLAGVAAFALQTAFGPDSQVPTLGASGAVAGVLGAYVVLYPRAKVVTAIFIVLFFTLIELPAFLVLGFWFVQQALFGYFDLTSGAQDGGGVAYLAHVGGFLFGLATVKLLATYRWDGADKPPVPVY